MTNVAVESTSGSDSGGMKGSSLGMKWKLCAIKQEDLRINIRCF